jgi:hypothetical protein
VEINFVLSRGNFIGQQTLTSMQIAYATSERMKCSSCKKAIGVDKIRVHKPSIYGAGAGYKSGWFHMKCYHQENVKIFH